MAETLPPPYPADTRAKGWRFELDYERIEQSGTWGAAMAMAMEGLPLARPLLLAMWYAAWKQVPCGSLPSNDRELAGAIGIPTAVLAEYREVLLRGWWVADDGRLYHPTLTARVVEMMAKRRSDADRQALKRAREAASAPDVPVIPKGVTPESRVTPNGQACDTKVSHAEVQPESSTDHRPPNTPSSPSAQKVPRKRANPPAEQIPRPDGVPEKLWADWQAVRKEKRAGPITETAWSGVQREAAKAGLSDANAVTACCEFSWVGFNAQWYADRTAGRSAQPASNVVVAPAWKRDVQHRQAVMTGGILGKANDQPEVFDVTAARVG